MKTNYSAYKKPTANADTVSVIIAAHEMTIAKIRQYADNAEHGNHFENNKLFDQICKLLATLANSFIEIARKYKDDENFQKYEALYTSYYFTFSANAADHNKTNEVCTELLKSFRILKAQWQNSNKIELTKEN